MRLLAAHAMEDDDRFTENKIRAMQEARKNGLAIRDSLSAWADDEDVVRNAISENPFAIRFAPDCQDNDDIAIEAVQRNGLTRFWLSPRLKQDQTIKRLAQETLPWQHNVHSARNKQRLFLGYIDESPFVQYITDFVQHTFILPFPHIIPIEDRKGSFMTDKNPICFLRDSHVTLFNGGHLLPYPIQKLKRNHLLALLPPSAHHLFHKTLHGKGFKESNVDQAMVTAYDFDISFRRGRTCIEGGNCFLFLSGGQHRAIIGEISLYLSMIALEEQGCFDNILIENIHQPSPHAYRIARNLKLYQQLRETEEEAPKSFLPPFSSIENPTVVRQSIDLDTLQRYEKILNYYQQLAVPVSGEDYIVFHHQAKKIEVQLQLTKIWISKELQVSVESITFVPQTSFHIDMDMFVTPNGEVVVHDDVKALEFLLEMGRNTELSSSEQELFELYYQTAEKKAFSFHLIQEMRSDLLKAHRLMLHTLPAVFKASSRSRFQSALNYCNGIFIREGQRLASENSTSVLILKKPYFSFITTGPSIPEEMIFHNKFLDLFSRIFPHICLQSVPDMSEIISRYNGGIRCLTFEDSLLSD